MYTRPRPRPTAPSVFRRALAVAALTALGGALSPLAAGATGNSASGHATHYPLALKVGKARVTIPSRPTSIVSLSPTATEMLYAIGAGAQVKAVDKDSDYPPSAPHTSLDPDSPNAEAIASYKPDLVIAADGSGGLGTDLGKLGIPLLVDAPADNLTQEYAQFLTLGKVTNHQAGAAAEVAKIKHQVARIVASVPKPAHPLTYYYELDQTYYSETSSTFIGQVLGLLGMHSIADAAKGAASSGGYPQLSDEFILKANPDYVILADTLCCAQSAKTVKGRAGWSNLSAVRDGRIVGLNDDIASRWGPRIVVLLSQVATELTTHPVSGG